MLEMRNVKWRVHLPLINKLEVIEPNVADFCNPFKVLWVIRTNLVASTGPTAEGINAVKQ
jgi:hypothetical protein